MVASMDTGKLTIYKWGRRRPRGGEGGWELPVNGLVVGTEIYFIDLG